MKRCWRQIDHQWLMPLAWNSPSLKEAASVRLPSGHISTEIILQSANGDGPKSAKRDEDDHPSCFQIFQMPLQ
jgi:hypothetical protein